jgi:hypothetical protein
VSENPRITEHESGGACWCGWVSIRCKTCETPHYGHELVHLDGKPETLCRQCAERLAEGLHTHKWGPVETARMTGNPHRKCQVPGCNDVSLDLDEC